MLIGVTGRSGAGKSEFSRSLATLLNGIHVDIDKECYKVIEVRKDQIAKALDIPEFSTTRELGEVIFKNRDQYLRAVKLVWPATLKNIQKIIKENSCRPVILDHILLPRMTPLWEQCSIKYLVFCEPAVRYKRVRARDKITEKYFQEREASSIEYFAETFNILIDTTSSKLTLPKVSLCTN